MMVFDEWQNGVPVAFVITVRQRQSDLAPWMYKVKAKCWPQRPSGIRMPSSSTTLPTK
jgi:hypothetical protein